MQLYKRRITIGLLALLVLVIVVWLVGCGAAAQQRSVPGAESGLSVEQLSELPAEAARTYDLVESEGPFPYPQKDGSTFGNREQLLPEQDNGYYREYTVPTPGLSHRGAQRLVTGEQDEVYYTGDHYDSFVVVDVDG